MRGDQRGRKQIRLPKGVYGQVGARALLTCVVDSRQSLFEMPEFAPALLDLLREQSVHDEIGILAYCLMPDHLHLLAQVDGSVDLITFVQTIKGKSTRLHWTFGHCGRLWQRSFHDRLLRETDDEREIIRYVLANPVRSGLVDSWQAYPYSGSFVYDLTDLR